MANAIDPSHNQLSVAPDAATAQPAEYLRQLSDTVYRLLMDDLARERQRCGRLGVESVDRADWNRAL